MRHGFLLVDKPTGITSHDVVYRVRKLLHEKDVGHLGTLDPAASGLLVLAVGNKALKMVELFSNQTKEYVADVRFGAISTTYDAEGIVESVVLKPGVDTPTVEALRRILIERFTGSIEQIPPQHSAVHIAGQRAYELARKGQTVEIPTRKVEITACDVLSFDYPNAQIHVACSSGTYIRSLAHDIGTLLRAGAYLSGLRRTKVGTWHVDQATKMDDVQWTNVMPLKEILKPLPSIELTGEEMGKIKHGQRIVRNVKPNTIGWFENLPVAVLVPYRDDATLAQPRKVLA